ncbi:MAG: ABC transporter permease [Desulfohalobiaceae bacterium]|nr:ABC transporter permease [Desulfohalobiaceae bacterium]
MSVKQAQSLGKLILLPALFGLLISSTSVWEILLRPAFPHLENLVYSRAPLWELVVQHANMVAVSSTLATLVGTGLGVFVTRSRGREFLPVVNSLVSMGQTFPPVAVLAVSVPMVGFGYKPTIIALFLYGLLPIVRNTISGLESVGPEIHEAAQGMGLTAVQTLFRVEVPLALHVIMAGIRTSVVINIGTATIGATIGAGGLGVPIIAGLNSDNPAFILQGAVLSGLFAILVDAGMNRAERGAVPSAQE